MPNLINGAAPSLKTRSQGFNRHIQTNLVAKLKTINHRFGRSINPHPHPFNSPDMAVAANE
jgi:hypothetical protein